MLAQQYKTVSAFRHQILCSMSERATASSRFDLWFQDQTLSKVGISLDIFL